MQPRPHNVTERAGRPRGLRMAHDKLANFDALRLRRLEAHLNRAALERGPTIVNVNFERAARPLKTFVSRPPGCQTALVPAVASVS